MFKIVAMFGPLLLFTSSQAFAACSPYVGDATLNEIMKEGGIGDAFIEIKLLDNSIPSTTYDQWTLKICHDEINGNNTSSQCKNISVAAMNDATQWIWAEEPIIDKDFIDFKEGFDLALLDENNQFIDYIQIGGYSAQNFTSSCSYNDLEYVFSIPPEITLGTKILLRKPDGTGRWLESENLNQYPPTPGANNDGFDHFEIIHDGQGLTCEAESITIKACANSSCTILNNDAFDVQLSINGSFDQTVTVVGGNTDTSFSYTSVGVAVLSLDKTYQCVNGASSSCEVIFADSGFRFFSNMEDTVIPEQLSAKPSNIGFNKSTLKIQAIEKNSETGACQAAFLDDIGIEMVATCVDPDTCAVSQVNINNLATDTLIPTLHTGVSLSYSEVALDFSDATVNSAEFVFTYPDAGKVQLHARYNIKDEDGNPTGNYMLGSSNAFVVRPLGFYINVNGNPKAQIATGAKFIAAGEDFTTSLTAVQWQAEDDSDENGVPDIGADLSNNTTTINFGNEATTEIAEITDSLYLPNSGIEGDLTNDIFTDFTNGVASNNNMTYSEVGIVNFDANLSNNSYLGASDIIGNEPYVGRFFPHHFELTAFDGALKSTCDITSPSIEMTFAYIGQMSSASSGKGTLQYLFQPEVTITPQAKLNTHTQNYTGDFNKLLLSGINRFEVDDGTGTLVLAPIEDAVRKGVDDTNKVKLTANFSNANLTETDAILSFEYSSDDNFVYAHEQNSEIIPFIADINLSLASVVDQDGVTANDADADGNTGIATDTVITLSPTGIEIRFGRAYLAHSFGPETSDLPQPFSVQYLKSVGQYVINELDTCTDFDAAKITLTSGTLNENLTGVNTAKGQFDDELPDGETRAMQLTAPGAGNQGTVGVEYEIYSWLKYDWNWNGVEIKVFDENPTATATFGLFRGNDRIIYQREVY